MKYFFSLLIFTAVVVAELPAQQELPGQSAVESVFGSSAELDLNLCCFAAYGWHIAPEMKHSNPVIAQISGDVAVYLLENNVTPQEEEQYFELPDGRFVVVSNIDIYNKVFGRYLINYKTK